MNPKFWLSVVFLMSRISFYQVAAQCQPSAEYSIRGMFLRGHTFKTYKIEWHESCFSRCTEEVTCQSYNYVIDHAVCELNNRTKEARPEDFIPDQSRFYMKRAKNRGTIWWSLFVCFTVPTRPFWMLQYSLARIDCKMSRARRMWSSDKILMTITPARCCERPVFLISLWSHSPSWFHSRASC